MPTTVCIDGSVIHGVCSISWQVQYRPSGGGSWTVIASGQGSVSNLVLATWSTLGVPDGMYDVMVSATSIGGVDDATVTLEVDNTVPTTLITAPLNCETHDGSVAIYGTVTDANLSSWALQWTGGPSHGWNTIASGNQPVIGGLLGVWDLSTLPSCAYTIRLIAWDTAYVNCSGNTHQSEYLVSIDVGGAPLACTGDMNCDEFVNFGDINPFVLYLSNFETWTNTYAGCPPQNGDINNDGVYGQASFGDINPFVALMTQAPLNCGG